jgi:hypothetical protein
MSVKQFGDEIVAAVRALIDARVAEVNALIEARISEVNARFAALPVPQDGKDADPIDVKAIIAEIIAGIPAPQDGKDADESAVAALVLAQIPKPKDGEDGKSVTIADVTPMIAEEVSKTLATWPRPKNGEPGKDAAPVDIDALKSAVLKEIPLPKDGTSVSMEDVRDALDTEFAKWSSAQHPVILDMVQRAMDRMPKPKDGEDGRDALEIRPVELDVTKSYPRGTYAFYRGGLIHAQRKTAPLLLNGDIETAGWMVAVNGIASMEVDRSEHGARFIVRTTAGEVNKVPIPSYRQIFKLGETYLLGDMVTFGGSVWAATKDNAQGKPGEPGSDWVLAVKHGRDLR